MFTLLHPWWLLLAPLPLLLRGLLPAHREAMSGVFLANLERLSRLTRTEPHPGAVVLRQAITQRAAVWVVWLLLVFASARPQWVGEPIEKTIPSRDVLLAVDLSGSMEVEDFTDDDGARLSRLDAVKRVLDDFLARREGDRVGLILFGNAAFVQAPFTEDLEVCRTLLDEAQVGMTGNKTMLGDAIGLGITTLQRSEVEEKVLILLTDGNDTGSRVPPREAAAIAADEQIVIHVVAVGDPEGAGEQPLDEETLQAIADTTGGGYFHAAGRDELEQASARIDELGTREVQTLSHRPTTELFAWPLGAAVVLSLLYHLALDLFGRARRAAPPESAPLAAPALLGAGSLAAFHFLRPAWLLVIPLGWWLVRRARRRLDPLGALREVADPHLLEALTIGSPEAGSRWTPSKLLLGFWSLAAVGLAGPSWEREAAPFQEQNGALVIALELTPTMLATDVAPTRLERGRHKIEDLLAARDAAPTALVAYAGSAHLVAPLTSDAGVFAPFLAELSPALMPREGDAASLAIGLADETLEHHDGAGSILLVTDGISENDSATWIVERPLDAAPIHVLGVGALAGEPAGVDGPPALPLDENALRELANSTNGSYTHLRPDDRDLERLVAQIDAGLRAAESDGGERWRDAGHHVLALLLLINAFWFRRGWVVARA